MDRVLESLILRWIRLCGRENRSSMTVSVARQKLYKWLDKGIEFHSPNRRFKSFKVRVGVPKLRARSPMTLQAHSLVFGLWEPSRVTLRPDRDNDFQNWYDFREKLVMGLGDDTWEQSHLSNLPLSLHPHISPDGVPCLGEFGAPWSGAIADSNIPALVNVAQSFLNNWTRADCYWDINYYHRDWQDEGQYHHGIRVFRDYLTIRKLAESINYDSGRGTSGGNNYRQFTDWYDNNKLELSGLKIDWETAFIAHLGYKKSLMRTIDTVDGDVRILKIFADKMARIYRLLLNKMLEEAKDVLKVGIYPIAEQVLCGIKTNARMFESSDTIFTIPPILEDITYRLASFSHQREGDNANLQMVLKSKSGICNTRLGDRVPKTQMFMTNSDVNQVLGTYIERSLIASRPLRTNAYRLLNFFRTIQYYGDKDTTHASVLSFDPRQIMADWLAIQGSDELTLNKRELYGEGIRSIMMQIHRALLPLTVTDINEKYFDKVYCEVTRILLKDITTLYKGVTNEHSKRRTYAYGQSTEQDSGENQLSIESF